MGAIADDCLCRSTLTSPIITLVVGYEARLFACHEDVLSISPFFAAALKGQFYESASKRVELPDEYVSISHAQVAATHAIILEYPKSSPLYLNTSTKETTIPDSSMTSAATRGSWRTARTLTAVDLSNLQSTIPV